MDWNYDWIPPPHSRMTFLSRRRHSPLILDGVALSTWVSTYQLFREGLRWGSSCTLSLKRLKSDEAVIWVDDIILGPASFQGADALHCAMVAFSQVHRCSLALCQIPIVFESTWKHQWALNRRGLTCTDSSATAFLHHLGFRSSGLCRCFWVGTGAELSRLANDRAFRVESDQTTEELGFPVNRTGFSCAWGKNEISWLRVPSGDLGVLRTSPEVDGERYLMMLQCLLTHLSEKSALFVTSQHETHETMGRLVEQVGGRKLYNIGCYEKDLSSQD